MKTGTPAFNPHKYNNYIAINLCERINFIFHECVTISQINSEKTL